MRMVSLVCLALTATMAVASHPAAAFQSGDQQQVKLAKGTWWGKVGDRVELETNDGFSTSRITGVVTKIEKGIITIEGVFGGRKTTRPIFASEILSLKTLDGNAPADEVATPSPGAPGAADAPVTPAAPVGPKSKPKERHRGEDVLGVSTQKATGKTDAQGYQLDEKGYRISEKRGVFVLPWKGGVGQTARAHEIEQMAREADKWGPGQVIVMELDTPGGLVTEIYKISDTLREVRKRHRVVAWIKEAISAGACTALHCDEIYFQTVGALGASTMITGAGSVKDEMLYQFMRELGEVVEANGRPAFLFFAMVEAVRVLTYTKDPVTGKVTFHDHVTGEPGEIVLSNEIDNLVFNASNALDCGLSKGTADTNEQLAHAMGLPEWHEISDYGRKMATSWQALFKQCEDDMQKQMARFNIQRAGGNVEQLQSQIQIGERILYWTKRCPPCADSMVDADRVEQLLKEWRRALADLRRQQRGG